MKEPYTVYQKVIAGERAERGSAILDNVKPDWYQKIGDTLDISDYGRCIVGQSYGYPYPPEVTKLYDALTALHPGMTAREIDIACGFDVVRRLMAGETMGAIVQRKLALEDSWREQIELRRKKEIEVHV